MNEIAAVIRRALREAARLPMIVLVIVASAILAWLGVWFFFRLGEFLFNHLLKASWT